MENLKYQQITKGFYQLKTLPLLITAGILLITPPPAKSVRTSNDAIRKYIKKTVVINEDGKQCVKTNPNFRKTDDGMVMHIFALNCRTIQNKDQQISSISIYTIFLQLYQRRIFYDFKS